MNFHILNLVKFEKIWEFQKFGLILKFWKKIGKILKILQNFNKKLLKF